MATTIQQAGRHVALGGSACRRTSARSTRRTSRRSPARSSCRGCSSRSSCARDGDGFELVAGFHRIAAARSLALTDVPVVVRDAETEDADRAVRTSRHADVGMT